MANQKIRYILGAGASAQKISPVEGFPDLIAGWKGRLSTEVSGIATREREVLHSYLQEMESLVRDTFSVDTLARMYSLRGDKEELTKLKTAITLILNLQQRLVGNDIRYDLFLSSLLSANEENLAFPSNIQIVSWNYDYQFELAISKILNQKQSSEDFKSLIKPNQLLKINGSSICDYTELLPKPNFPFHATWFHSESEFIEKIATSLDHPRKPIGNIKFAWENQSIDLKSLEAFKPDVTVVIGYSFPIFNRSVDLKLINSDRYSQSKPVYIQCNAPESKQGNAEVRTKLLGMGIKDSRIKDVDTSSEFLVPYEFNIPKAKTKISASLMN